MVLFIVCALKAEWFWVTVPHRGLKFKKKDYSFCQPYLEDDLTNIEDLFLCSSAP